MLKGIDPNDLKRIIRAIEIFELSGQKKSDQTLEINADIVPYIIGIDVDRNILYNRINTRVDKMIELGLESEISFLKQNGYYDEKSFNDNPLCDDGFCASLCTEL